MSDQPEESRVSNGQRAYIGIIVGLALTSIFYRLLVSHHLEQTSLLFIGIPAILGIAAVMVDTPETAAGYIVRTITLGLALAAVALGEGAVCILFSAPIFYAVGLIIWCIFQVGKAFFERFFLCALLFPFMFEGVAPILSFPREETVTVSRTIAASTSEVEHALSLPPRVDQSLPLFLRIGFPRPVEARGGGLHKGDLRVIHFAGGEGHPGDVIMTVAEVSPGRVLFVATSDRSKVAHWLDWRSSDVRFTQVDATHTRVDWTIGFTRRLDPAWYFRPWERLAVREAASYLIDTNATPAADSPANVDTSSPAPNHR